MLRAGGRDRASVDPLHAAAQSRHPHPDALGEEGRDLEAWLPCLAAYMGHQKYSSTAWYVHLLPGRLAATGLTSAAGIIPAVTP